MKVSYHKKFLKQLANLPPTIRTQIETFAFERLPSAESLSELGVIEKMHGHRGYYKTRFGAYRVGMKVENNMLILQVVMDRKEIYRFFP
ncbi:type II toxin-antitoxin system RelE/ParE family toxin [Rhodoferax sp. 4810]|uniref:Type II toxin-antitoxin system RelE/ParE family toxin n=1 Tax=Thiospirillum jenense TaxID=1653858 RepID=A0A839HEP2_9GAMM|nr:type II toxin-antitoxin system RelE/ParE family toxin [Thiospirillum jenense]MBB1077760.1 type II toxin-antitoxin system RelE/ParE family toxin [Rhodoferax jenense]MBB1127323.1 type II toxin-antitoxin system RelE/ParE family toxin [Thiospirillum jenense]